MRVIRYFSVFLALSTAAFADQTQFKIVDVLWSHHPSYGDGVEFIYQFDSKPDDDEDALQAFVLSECNRIAPKYVPKVLAKIGQPRAAFVAMNFRFGGAVGTYEKYFAHYDAGVCSYIE